MKFEDLSEVQTLLFDNLVRHVTNSDNLFYRVSGVAGSGKSTVISLLRETGLKIRYMTFTGKASEVLRSKGVQSYTTHSQLYSPLLNENDVIIGWKANSETLGYIEKVRADTDVFVVDEAGMLPVSIIEEIAKYEIPTILIGDNQQLPSIDGSNVLDNPDFTISEIHRQSEGNPIILESQHVLKYGRFSGKTSDAISYVPLRHLGWKFFKENQFNIVICGTNAFRRKYTNMIRTSNDHYETHFYPGEQVICLKNSLIENQMVYNGELFTCEKHHRISDKASNYRITNANKSLYLKIDDETILNEFSHKEPTFTYGNVITCHKSQGSEFRNVLFIDQNVSSFLDQKAYRYTGLTRATTKITIAR